MPAKQVVVHRGPVGGRVPAAASGDPRQQQDHQQTEQGMFDRPASIVPELSKSSADVHKHASSLTLLKLVGDETWSSSCAVPSACRRSMNSLPDYDVFCYKAMRRPCIVGAKHRRLSCIRR